MIGLNERTPLPGLSGLVPGCLGCQLDGMQEHYVGVHLCWDRPFPICGKQPWLVWDEWLKDQQFPTIVASHTVTVEDVARYHSALVHGHFKRMGWEWGCAEQTDPSESRMHAIFGDDNVPF